MGDEVCCRSILICVEEVEKTLDERRKQRSRVGTYYSVGGRWCCVQSRVLHPRLEDALIWHHDMSRFTPDGPGPIHACPPADGSRFESLVLLCGCNVVGWVGMSHVLLVCLGADFVSAIGDGHASKKTMTHHGNLPKRPTACFPWSPKKTFGPVPLPGMTPGTAGKSFIDLPSECDHAVGSITSL